MKTSDNYPLVSIITPAYNRASYLDETIMSVLNQDYFNLEYIVLDDGSTDNTQEKLKKHEGELYWETHSNMGETRTVNKGFSLAKGDIIGVVNSDDPLLPNAVSKIVQFMLCRPDVVVVYPDWNMIDEKGSVIQHIKTYDYSYINMLRWHHCIPGPGTFFRKKIVEKLHGRDIHFRYVGDLDFWLQAGLIGLFARIPETLATFRMHPESASINQQSDLMGEEHIRLVNKIYSIPNLPEEIIKIKNEAYSSAYYIAGVVCGNNTKLRRSYYRKAFFYKPMKYFSEYFERLLIMLPVFLGPFYKAIRLLIKRKK